METTGQQRHFLTSEKIISPVILHFVGGGELLADLEIPLL